MIGALASGRCGAYTAGIMGSQDTQEHDGPLKILVVEDHADTAHLLAQVLKIRKHAPAVAGAVAEALGLARDRAFDVVISDLSLPDGSGLDLMRQLRELQPGLKGIAMSGYDSPEDVEATRAAGFSEHLGKPLDLNKLEEAIGRVAGRDF